MTIKAVLFDLDGTLVDSNDLHVRASLEVFADKGVHDRTADAVHAQIGKGADLRALQGALPGSGPALPAGRDLLARVKKAAAAWSWRPPRPRRSLSTTSTCWTPVTS